MGKGRTPGVFFEDGTPGIGETLKGMVVLVVREAIKKL
jgi:hypothetical protein